MPRKRKPNQLVATNKLVVISSTVENHKILKMYAVLKGITMSKVIHDSIDFKKLKRAINKG